MKKDDAFLEVAQDAAVQSDWDLAAKMLDRLGYAVLAEETGDKVPRYAVIADHMFRPTREKAIAHAIGDLVRDKQLAEQDQFREAKS